MRLDTSHTARSMPFNKQTEALMLTSLFIVAFLPLTIMVGVVLMVGFISMLFK